MSETLCRCGAMRMLDPSVSCQRGNWIHAVSKCESTCEECRRLRGELDEARGALRIAEERIALQGAIIREARWFRDHVYPPDVFLPDASPGPEADPLVFHAKRINAAFDALTTWKRGGPQSSGTLPVDDVQGDRGTEE